MTVCVGFIWDNFLPKCGAGFWACAENSVDNSGMFSHCWSGLAQSQGLFGSSAPEHFTTSWRWLCIFQPMDVVNKYLVTLCWHVWLLLYLLNCPYLKPWVFSHFYPSNSVPHPTGSEWMSICVEPSFHLGLSHDAVKYKLWKIHSQPWRQNSGYMPWKKIVFESTNTCTIHIWGNRPIKGLLFMSKNRKSLVLLKHLQSDL